MTMLLSDIGVGVLNTLPILLMTDSQNCIKNDLQTDRTFLQQFTMRWHRSADQLMLMVSPIASNNLQAMAGTTSKVAKSSYE